MFQKSKFGILRPLLALAVIGSLSLAACTSDQQAALSSAGEQALKEAGHVLGSVAVSALVNAATQEAQSGKVDWQQAGTAGLWANINAQDVLSSAGRIYAAYSGGKAPLTTAAVDQVAQTAPANTQAGKAQVINAIATVISTATGAPPKTASIDVSNPKTKPMNIRAKMYCEAATKNDFGGENVTLRAVTSGSEENKSFSEATPCASVQMTITNPAAQGAFAQGAEYYVDFAPAAPASEATVA